MSRAASARRAGSTGGANPLPGPDGYLQESSQPLASLILILPLIVLYELGSRYFTTAALHGRDQQIIAFSRMHDFFSLFGATAPHLPALAVVASLLAWHIVRNDTWRLNVGTFLGMTVESVLLSLPLFLFGTVLSRYLPMAAAVSHRAAAASTMAEPTRDMLIMSMGAGVYEEFVFRLAGFALLSVLFKDLLKLKVGETALLMVLTSALLFSAYHYWGTSEIFVARIFIFRTLAGAYFGAIFLLRGFGITAASHSIYDLVFTATLLS